MKKIVFLFVFCTLAALSSSQAQPQNFNYQSVIRDANGDIVDNQAVMFRTSIIEGTNSTAVYTETHAVSTNEFGLA